MRCEFRNSEPEQSSIHTVQLAVGNESEEFIHESSIESPVAFLKDVMP